MNPCVQNIFIKKRNTILKFTGEDTLNQSTRKHFC